MPWCTFTEPEIAHVGMYEHDAKQKGIEVETYTYKLEEVDRAILDGEDEGFARIHIQKGTDKIVGATIVAAHAGDMISEFSVLMKAGAGAKTLAGTIHPYPTQAEVNKKVVKLALASALSDRFNEGRVVVADDWGFSKTKDAVAALRALGIDGTVLVVVNRDEEAAAKAFRNIPSVQLVLQDELNAYDVLCNKHILFSKKSVPTPKALQRAFVLRNLGGRAMLLGNRPRAGETSVRWFCGLSPRAETIKPP